jgi:hypothetical protein
MEHNTKGWFHEGVGNVSAKVAKSDSEILSEEAEILEVEAEGVEGTEGGAKPVYPTGSSPFHSGRGSGRGHSV